MFQLPTAYASNFGMLLAFRFLTGFFGSPALATGGATIADMYRPQKQAYGLAVWGIGAVCGPVLGPLVGEIILYTLSTTHVLTTLVRRWICRTERSLCQDACALDMDHLRAHVALRLLSDRAVLLAARDELAKYPVPPYEEAPQTDWRRASDVSARDDVGEHEAQGCTYFFHGGGLSGN